VVQYSTDLFDGSTIARLTARFEMALGLVVAEPDTLLSEIRTTLFSGPREWAHKEKDLDSLVDNAFKTVKRRRFQIQAS